MELKVASDRFNTIVQEIGGLTRTIRSEAESTSGFFQGQAAMKFRTVMVAYDENAANLNQALGVIANAIMETSRNFDTTDADSSAAFGSASSGLNM